MAITIQTNAHQFNRTGVKKYALSMGGLNVTHDALQQYDPLIGGYYRLFMVRKPTFLTEYFKGTGKFGQYKHILEYGNLGVSGLSDLEMQFDELKGGYAGRTFEIPKMSEDSTKSFTVKVYEFSGSLMREIHHTWINCVADEQTGFAHYGGLIANNSVQYSQANQTAEFIYVVTDRTGMQVEYACMFCNCFPTRANAQHFDSESGEHSIVTLDLEFRCTKYTGVDVNDKARILLRNNQIMVNSLEFFSGLDFSDMDGSKKKINGYDPTDGKLKMMDPDKFKVSPRNDIAGNYNWNKFNKLDMPTPSFTNFANQNISPGSRTVTDHPDD